jgi:DNA-binding CsgD family transcriptional regulator
MAAVSVAILGEASGMGDLVHDILIDAGVRVVAVADRALVDVVVVVNGEFPTPPPPVVALVRPGSQIDAIKAEPAAVITTDEVGILPQAVTVVAGGHRVCPGSAALLNLLGDDNVRLFRLVCSGKTDEQIGEAIGYSRRQVQRRIGRLFHLLGVEKRAEALWMAGRFGISLAELRPD